MPLGAQLPVRLDPEVQARLEAIAREIGTSKSALLRLLAKTFVEQVADAKGRVEMPPNWRELFARLPAADGRTPPLPRPAGRRAPAAPAAAAPSSAPDAVAAKLLRQHVPSAPRRGEG